MLFFYDLGMTRGEIKHKTCRMNFSTDLSKTRAVLLDRVEPLIFFCNIIDVYHILV